MFCGSWHVYFLFLFSLMSCLYIIICCGSILVVETVVNCFVNRYDIKLNNAILAEDKHLPM